MTKRITRKDKAKDKALEDRLFTRLMDHIGPILADTFNQQNDYIAVIMDKTIKDGYELILKHSIDERKQALADLEDGGEALAEDAGKYIKTKEEKEDDDEVQS